MRELISWTVVFVGVLTAITAAQSLQFYVLRHWRARVDLPDTVAYTDAPSFRCDQEIVLRIHSSKPVRARFRRCADTGLTTTYTVEAAASLQPRTMHRWRGFEWKASVVLPSNTLM